MADLTQTQGKNDAVLGEPVDPAEIENLIGSFLVSQAGVRQMLDQVWLEIGYRSAVQGNLDPAVPFAPLSELRMRIHELLQRTGARPGHVFNVGRGLLPSTPVENVKACVQIVREFKI